MRVNTREVRRLRRQEHCSATTRAALAKSRRRVMWMHIHTNAARGQAVAAEAEHGPLARVARRSLVAAEHAGRALTGRAGSAAVRDAGADQLDELDGGVAEDEARADEVDGGADGDLDGEPEARRERAQLGAHREDDGDHGGARS